MKPILPGSIIGVLGSGQLGRMFAIAARRMGYRVWTYSPDQDTPTGQIADEEWTASYEDLDRVRQFAGKVAVVTFEFENVLAETAAAAAEKTEVRPAGTVLHTTQNRLREKNFLRKAGLPVTPYRVVESLESLRQALVDLGAPAILKSADFGYDGKGQFRLRSAEDAAVAWKAVGPRTAVLEAYVDYQCECSVVAARGVDGSFVAYDVIRNEHERGILDVSEAPARLDANLRNEANLIARSVLEALDVVGVLCIEFFVTRDGALLINELAPRPHNSGHLTVDAAVTSQFEQQLRAVCGLPLGSPELLAPAAMANLLGDHWANGEPDWASACARPNVKLHLYGKLEARPGRKMGHLTALGNDAVGTVKRARALL